VAAEAIDKRSDAGTAHLANRLCSVASTTLIGGPLTQGNPQAAARVREGQVLAGKYRVERVLGVGGMGVVVAATHVQLDEKVAIKFLLPAMLSNQEVVGRFAREARAAVKIKSEHVARISDVGMLDNGAPYMVMEFLEGVDLAVWLQKQGPLPLAQAVDFVLQACVGVASAHGIGIVHRDLKPANLFCLRGNDGQFIIKVLDFGISKVTNPSGPETGGSMTHTAAVMGSPFYMSPEQMVSTKDVDARTDIWALGVVLYELLTGTTPFASGSFAEIAIKVATGSFAPLRSLRPDAKPGLDVVISKCLEKDKGRRYGNVAELALALTDFGSVRSRGSIERIVGIIQASGLSKSAPAPLPSPGVSGAVNSATATAFQREPSGAASLGTMAPSASAALGGRRRPKTLAIVGIAGIVSVSAIVGLLAWAKHQPSAGTLLRTIGAPALGPSSLPTPTSVVSETEKPVEIAPATAIAAVATAAAPASLPVVPRVAATMNKPTEGPSTSGRAHANPGARPSGPTQSPTPSHQSTPAAAGTTPNCNPNFTWGPHGNKIFKPECF
jgi:serine/threonine protein kinase